MAKSDNIKNDLIDRFQEVYQDVMKDIIQGHIWDIDKFTERAINKEKAKKTTLGKLIYKDDE